MKVVTARQMQDLDHKTIHDIGIPGIVLMENAGRGTFNQVLRYFPGAGKKSVVVICGRGNNGGDGFVIARYLHNEGIRVKALLLSTIEKVSGDAEINLRAFRNAGGTVSEVTDENLWRGSQSDISHAGLIVDALLGTGLSSEVQGLYKTVIDDINAAPAPIVSVDVPSGVDATTGKILGTAVRAGLTCTFGLPKRGLLIYPGLSHSGNLEVIDIGIPNRVIDQASINEFLLEGKNFRGAVSCRSPEAHKGTFGHVFILAGSPGKTGAAAMTAEAAMRTGAGLVTLGVPETLNPVLESKITEVMTEPLPDYDGGFLGTGAWDRIESILDGKSVLAIGPGISDRDETCRLVYKAVELSTIPLVIDADGLNALAKKPEVMKNVKAPIVVTPHPGEMARLSGTTAKDIQSDRVTHARRFAAEFGVIVVLKGARTIIADPHDHIYINTTGNPGMASGGMGDVLTGMIAGLIAQGISPLQASTFSVFVHGLIGDTIEQDRAGIGIMATDIIDRIPGTLQQFMEK